MPELIGLLPAAGKGVRLGLPYPKELYPIIRDNRYKPVAQYAVENLVRAGIEHIVFIINETKHQLVGYFGDGSRFHCNFSYVVQERRESENQSTSPGLAHALNSAYHLTQGKTVCFAMPDTLVNPQSAFDQVLKAMQPDDALALGVFPITRPEKSGVVDYDENYRVSNIIDKPHETDLPHGWAIIAWQPVFTEHLRRCIQEWGIYDFAVVMNLAINAGMALRAVVVEDGSYTDLGTFEDLMELERQYRAP